VSYSTAKEEELLRLLNKSADPDGIYYSWASDRADGEHIADKLTELHFDQMEAEGLVSRKWATKDGAHFIITPFGRRKLEHYDADRKMSNKLLGTLKHPLIGWVSAGFMLIWIVFSQVVSASWICPKLPNSANNFLSKCDEYPVGKTK